MSSFMNSLFGSYVPTTTIVDGVEVALNGAAGVDWEYVGSVAIFIVFLFCVFRFVGGLLHK